MFVGIDPGKTGGVAIVSHDGSLIHVGRFDNADPLVVLAKALDRDGIQRIAVEAVHAMPGQGVCSMFTFGVGYGQILGYLSAVVTTPGIVTRVTPQAWKKILPPAEGPKEAAKAFCISRWGEVGFIFLGCRNPHSGAMDAACIAEHARQVYAGEITAPKVPIKKARRQPIKLAG